MTLKSDVENVQQSRKYMSLKFTEELHTTAMRNDAKFEDKLT